MDQQTWKLHDNVCYQLSTYTFTPRYQFSALSKANFRFINSWITSTMLHIFVMISVLEETFLIHHLESIDGFKFPLSAHRVLSKRWRLKWYRKFCLHDDPALVTWNRFNYDERVKDTFKLKMFTGEVTKFYAHHGIFNVLAPDMFHVHSKRPWRLKTKRKNYSRSVCCETLKVFAVQWNEMINVSTQTQTFWQLRFERKLFINIMMLNESTCK